MRRHCVVLVPEDIKIIEDFAIKLKLDTAVFVMQCWSELDVHTCEDWARALASYHPDSNLAKSLNGGGHGNTGRLVNGHAR